MGEQRPLKIDETTFVCGGCGFSYGPQNPTESAAQLLSPTRGAGWQKFPLLARKDGDPIIGDAAGPVPAHASGKSQVECPSCGTLKEWGRGVYKAKGVSYSSARPPRDFTWLTEDALDD
jgi:rubredoxin